ncbi:conserved Plasmodium protein, unknown function [Plasmodium gallinaceum]|uniref:Uncharacterized protein n=1 Tax=Plasmodium gallinaceum TaxID=5849 RepID=A0A1J1GMB8_PLAGA|nr:conserved Plasmodium protein, unknown function [Plasmodium gallinaceum]CRG93574.1 conserved Plasmodium protein, unknown function [Plasmodium gallinaceum]
MNKLELDAQCLIRALKYFSKDNSATLSENDCKKIFNKILSQDLNDENIREIIKNIKADIKWNKLNYVENFMLSPSILHILINKQLKKHELEIIFKDFFKCIQTNNVINTNDLKRFLRLCNINISQDSLLYLCKVYLNLEDANQSADYNAFVNMMKKYLTS